MRKYGICLLLFVVLAAACFTVGYAVTRTEVIRESAVPATEYETETVDERPVAEVNASPQPTDNYYLTAENGYLMVYEKNRMVLYLDTHIPLAEFPETEKERLLDGIWFSSMVEVFQYLESYTS